MNKPTYSLNAFWILFGAILFILITDLLIIFNIPILRQITSFIFLTFLPGLLLIYILKLQKLKLVEKFVFSIGLSIFLLMFIGLLMNYLYPLFGYKAPLSAESLLITLSAVTLIFCVVAFIQNWPSLSLNFGGLKLNIREKFYLLVPAIFPLLSIIGMRLMNVTSNNIIIVILSLSIPGYAIFLGITHDKLPEKIATPAILCISIAIILLVALRSNYIIGYDANTEYYIFQRTFESGRWMLVTDAPLDTCLSISILPTIYQSFLNINSQYLFKILYPLLFSISPLIIYLICRKYVNVFYSFLAALFFMSQYYFLNAEMAARTVIALLFFALSIMVIFHDRLRTFDKYLLFFIFSTAIILSHYSTAFISLGIFVVTWLIATLMRKIMSSRLRSNSVLDTTDTMNRLTPAMAHDNNHLSLGMVGFYVVVLCVWYSVVASGTTIHYVLSFISSTFTSLHNFFDIASRGSAAVIFGSGLKSFPQKINFIFSWLTIIVVAIGVFVILVQYKKMTTAPVVNKGSPPPFLLQQFDLEFLIFALVCCLILAVSVALPYVLVGYDMERTYLQAIVILAPFFIVGGIALSSVLEKITRKNHVFLVTLLILVPYFLCNTGIVYQAFGVAQSITLNSTGQDYDYMVVHPQESYAAQWLGTFEDQTVPVYSDYYGKVKLIGQGGILGALYAKALIESDKPFDGYFFVGYTGFVNGELLDSKIQWHEMSEYNKQFASKNLIYSDGGSGIFH